MRLTEMSGLSKINLLVDILQNLSDRLTVTYGRSTIVVGGRNSGYYVVIYIVLNGDMMTMAHKHDNGATYSYESINFNDPDFPDIFKNNLREIFGTELKWHVKECPRDRYYNKGVEEAVAALNS